MRPWSCLGNLLTGRRYNLLIKVLWPKAERTGALVTCARIWREIFKLIWLAFPFF